jgi:group II intron reverse transcriptase/maturase
MDELRAAFKAVKRNGGAPGIDGVTVKDFGQRLSIELGQLEKELTSWSYEPKPVRQVDIPKPDGGTRRLGVPCVRDRVVQGAIKAVLEPIYEPLFSMNSYGFRPNRNQWQAIHAAQHIVQSGKEHIVDIDLEKFFDRVQHDRLIHRLSEQVDDKRVLRLIGTTLRSGIMKDGIVTATEEGTVQGSPLSPLLSNVVLDELDKELERRGLQFCRYADDCNIFTGSEKAAIRVMESVTRFIERKLKLVVNKTKSQATRSQFVKFLGITIVAGSIAISAKSMARAMDKVLVMTSRGTTQTLEKTLEGINSWYLGWANYYKVTQYPSQLAAIEAHVRRRLRARIVSQQKRRRHLVQRLIERGVPRRLAFKTVYTNRQCWALSHTPAVERAYSNKWFLTEVGQKTMLDKPQPHWFPRSRVIKLS